MIPPESKDALLKRAQAFLAQDSIKDAPLDQKTAFLASKGLSSTEIDLVLQQLNPESIKSPETPESQESLNKSDLKAIGPLISYPEYPPPQIPTRRLSLRNVLFAIYLSAGTAATIYAAVTWIFIPMLNQLTAARRDLHHHTLKRIKSFITQLKTVDERKPYETTTDSTSTAQLLSQITCKISDIQQTFPTYVLNEISFSTEEFKTLLDGMMYSSNFNFNNYSIYPSGTGKTENKASQIKNEIRSIKGAIINIRNFPLAK